MGRRLATVTTAAAMVLSGIVEGSIAAAVKEGRMTLRLTSSVFDEGGEIPVVYTCDGRDVSPPLEWTGVPPEASSLALIVDDPDAPDPRAPKMTWVHWVLYDLPAGDGGLSEEVGADTLPASARQGRNDWKRLGYGGPCPPIGSHRYFFKLYALDTMLGDLGEPTKEELLAAMAGHVVASAELIGTFQRRR